MKTEKQKKMKRINIFLADVDWVDVVAHILPFFHSFCFVATFATIFKSLPNEQ